MSFFKSFFSSTTKPTEPNPVPCKVPTIEQLNNNTMYSQINSLDELCTLQKYEHFFVYYPSTHIIRCNFFNKKEKDTGTYSFFNRETNGNPESRMMTAQFNHDYRYYKKVTLIPLEITKGGRRRKSKRRKSKRRKTRRRRM